MTDKVVFLGSTRGGILSRLAEHGFVRQMTHEVVADRDCGLLAVAAASDMVGVKLPASSGREFSRALQQRYVHQRGLVFLSFYTRLFTEPLLAATKGRLFNCHPSILPACPGMRGFEDTLASNSLFMGCTLHQIDAGMDTGAPVIQAALPLDRRLPPEVLRHRLFLAQYYAALQFLRWISQDRLAFDETGRASVLDAQYGLSAFCPNLDEDFFQACDIPNELA